ncbi:MAG: hypothetical protein JW839_04830 [Candidatus Lokiarchaeota archaeon]|nr:hypothetical protein [Candidatus Lokiarchaeota archaeon]
MGESSAPPAGKKQFFLLAKISEIKRKQKEEQRRKLELWGDIGYHRYLGGDFYNRILALLVLPVSLLLFGVVTEIFLPGPEVSGYQDLTKSLLGFFFGVMDIGLAGSQGYFSDKMQRFVAEHAEIHPEKAVHQIQFFVFWQMWTGLVQVTVVGLYCFYFLANTTLAHMAYFIIFYSFVQFPGMLQIFESLFQCYQRYDMHGLVTSVRDAVFAPLATILCVFLGKFIGGANPAIGEVMGITIGFLTSIYVADIYGMIFGARLFSKRVLDKLKVKHRFSDFFRPEFNRQEVKEIISFIGPIQIVDTLLGFMGMITTVWITQWVTSYASWKGLISFAGTVAGLAAPGGSNKATATVSQAYNNGKIELTHNYMNKILKYDLMNVTVNLIPVIILLPTVLDQAIKMFPTANIQNYLPALVVLPVSIIMNITNKIWFLPNQMLVIATRRNAIMVFNVVGPFVNFFFSWLFLVYFQLGWLSLILMGWIPTIIFSLVKWVYMLKRITPKFKPALWQIAAAPLISQAGMAGFSFLVWLAMPPIIEAITAWGFLVILVFLLFMGNSIVYQVFYSLAGGWDRNTIEEYHKGVELSGPSKFMVKPAYLVAKFFTKLAPLHDRFPIANEDAAQVEIGELMALRDKNIVK